MNHNDHLDLLRHGIKGTVWTDIGSGTGAFTLALADLLGKNGTIYSVDRDQGALRTQAKAMQARFPEVNMQYLHANFTKPLQLPSLDGIVMANALHFMKNHASVVSALKQHLKPEGHFILIEYNTDKGNQWVPHALRYTTWEKLASSLGFIQTEKIAAKPSRFLGEIYAALSKNASS